MSPVSNASLVPCPVPADLAVFLNGDFPPHRMDEIGAHVSRCAHCELAVRRMNDSTSLAFSGGRTPSAVRGPREPAPVPAQLGQYRLGEQIGRGGMGAVYRAEHVRLKKRVAIKILDPDQTRDRRAAARFQLEMEIIGQLDHPNVVRATDAGEAEGLHFLVMELVDGVTLSALIHGYGPLPVREACELVRQAAVGLQNAHEHGLVHRDVKPSNLMLSATGQVKLLDLGLARLRGDGPAPGALTRVGEVMGTAEYMAPEQWEETHTVDIRADIYSLGCTLYALLAGVPPFTGGGRGAFLRLMAAHQEQPVPPVATRRADVPLPLRALLERMLAKDPADRPATPGAVAAELAPLAAGAELAELVSRSAPEGRAVRPRTGPAPLQARATRRRRLMAVSSVVIAAGIATGLLLLALRTPAPTIARPSTAPPPDPGKWRNLLTVAPEKRLWHPGDISFCNYDPDRQRVTVLSSQATLLRLGETDADMYRLQVGFKQMPWLGGFGVYLGGQTAPNGEFVCHLVHLVHSKMGPGREFAFSRSWGCIQPPRPGERGGLGTVGFASSFVEPPGSEELIIDMEIWKGTINSVRWGGDQCDELTDGLALEQSKKLSRGLACVGEFGIFSYGGTVTVLTARYLTIK